MMKRTTVDNRTVNQRTKDMLDMWQFNALRDLYVVQGSYNSGVGASAGTHDGGGAIDVSTYGWGDAADKKWIIKQGRLAGFAAWLRPTLPGVWNEHAHAVAIGDPELARGAANQVKSYYAGRNGLANNGPDPDPRVRITVWPNRQLKKISALTAYRQFKTKNPKARATVKRIQWVLNEKLGTDLYVDGVAGPATREAYKKWEKKIDAPVADGIPGRASLNKLGVGRFKVGYTAYEKLRAEQKAKRQEAKQAAAEQESKNPTYCDKK